MNQHQPDGGIFFDGAMFELGLVPLESAEPKVGVIYQETDGAEQVGLIGIIGGFVINQTTQEPEQTAIVELDLSTVPRTGIISQETQHALNTGRIVVQIFNADYGEDIVNIAPRFGETIIVSADDTSGATAVEIGQGEKVVVENTGIARAYVVIGDEDIVATVPGVSPGSVPIPVGRQVIFDSYFSNNNTKTKYIAAVCGAGEETTLQVYTAVRVGK